MAGSINLNNTIVASTIDEASANVLGTHYISDNPQYYEIQRTNNFVFFISGLSKSLGLAGQNDYADANADEVIKISVKEGFVPHFSVNQIALKRGNNTMKFAGNPEFGDGQIALDDFIGAGTYDILEAWKNKVYNPKTEKVGLANDYKRDAYLLEYTPDWQLVRTYVIKGCWLSDVSKSNPSADSADKQSISATVVYDKAWIDN